MTVSDPRKRDLHPKTDLYNGYIGDGYPTCRSLPPQHFLKVRWCAVVLGVVCWGVVVGCWGAVLCWGVRSKSSTTTYPCTHPPTHHVLYCTVQMGAKWRYLGDSIEVELHGSKHNGNYADPPTDKTKTSGYLLARSLTHSPTQPFTHSPTRPFSPSPILSLIHSVRPSLNPSLQWTTSPLALTHHHLSTPSSVTLMVVVCVVTSPRSPSVLTSNVMVTSATLRRHVWYVSFLYIQILLYVEIYIKILRNVSFTTYWAWIGPLGW